LIISFNTINCLRLISRMECWRIKFLGKFNDINAFLITYYYN
jgi:hypothetical protein